MWGKCHKVRCSGMFCIPEKGGVKSKVPQLLENWCKVLIVE